MDGNKLREVDHQKYLGIIFDKRLLWDHQVNGVCKIVAYYLHLLSIHHKSLTFLILKLLSESLIFSRTTYVCFASVGSTFKKRSDCSCAMTTKLCHLNHQVIM